MSGSRSRTGVHLVTYWRPRQSSADDIAQAFLKQLAEFRRRYGWMDRAACAEVGGDTWFPEKGEPTDAAKQVCKRCPVKAECLDFALETGDRHGVWGGLSERQRRDIQRARERQAAA